MSRFGVWQLQKLTLRCSSWGGSSKGARPTETKVLSRAFKEELLGQLRADNPQIEIIEREERTKHPTLHAEYRNGRTRTVDLRNKDPEEILRFAYFLRSCSGRKTSKPLERHVLPKVVLPGSSAVLQASPSVQGTWNSELFRRTNTQ